jgi:hypothetical protein
VLDGAVHPVAVQEKMTLHCGLAWSPYSQSSPTGEQCSPALGWVAGQPAPPPDPLELLLLPEPLVPEPPLLPELPDVDPDPDPEVDPDPDPEVDPELDPDPPPASPPMTKVEPPHAHIPVTTRTAHTLERMPSPPEASVTATRVPSCIFGEFSPRR